MNWYLFTYRSLVRLLLLLFCHLVEIKDRIVRRCYQYTCHFYIHSCDHIFFLHRNTLDHTLIHSKDTDRVCCNLSNNIQLDNLYERNSLIYIYISLNNNGNKISIKLRSWVLKCIRTYYLLSTDTKTKWVYRIRHQSIPKHLEESCIMNEIISAKKLFCYLNTIVKIINYEFFAANIMLENVT